MSDPYKILGVSRTASADEIKSAYRKLAKKLHPDVNPGKKDIEQRFKEVTAAYDLLSDASKRARFDRGEVDAQGNERGFSGDPFGGGGGRGGGTWRTQSGGGDPFGQFGGSVEDILAEFMSGARGKRGSAGGGTGGFGGFGSDAGMGRGGDTTYSITVPFVDAALGGKQRINLTGSKSVDVVIPPGTDEGHKLRLRGQGQGGGGDAIFEVHVEPHPHFTRKGNDIHLEAPVSLPEAVLGAAIKVPTLDGHVTVKVPKGSNTGAVLRLKGKGVPTGKTGESGDMFVKLKIVLPDPVPSDLGDVIEKWAKKNAYDPRKKLDWD